MNNITAAEELTTRMCRVVYPVRMIMWFTACSSVKRYVIGIEGMASMCASFAK